MRVPLAVGLRCLMRRRVRPNAWAATLAARSRCGAMSFRRLVNAFDQKVEPDSSLDSQGHPARPTRHARSVGKVAPIKVGSIS